MACRETEFGGLAIEGEPSNEDGAAIIAALKAAGITGKADFEAKIDALVDNARDAGTLAALKTALYQILKILALRAKHGDFKIV